MLCVSGIYFTFVMMISAISVSMTMLVLCVFLHAPSNAAIACTPLPRWVSLAFSQSVNQLINPSIRRYLPSLTLWSVMLVQQNRMIPLLWGRGIVITQFENCSIKWQSETVFDWWTLKPIYDTLAASNVISSGERIFVNVKYYENGRRSS